MSVVVSFRTPEKIDSVVSLTALLQFFLTIQGNLECEQNRKECYKNCVSVFHKSNVTFSYEI